jgi:AAA domain
MNTAVQHQVIYATPTQVITVGQDTTADKPPSGFEGGVALLPLVNPQRAGIERTPWLVEGWLRAGGVTILSARYKSLKSYFARQLAISIAAGHPFLDTHAVLPTARGRPVAIVCAEESYNDVVNAVWRAARGLGLSPQHIEQLPIRIQPALGKTLFEKTGRHGRVQPTAAFHATRKALVELRPALVVVDTLVAVKGDAGENSADDIRPVFQWFRQLGAAVGATVLIVDHEGFDQVNSVGEAFAKRRPRGSSDKVGAVDDTISLETEETTIPSGSRHTVEARLLHRGAAGAEETVTVLFQDPDGPIRFLGPRSPTTAATIDEDGKDLVSILASDRIASKRQLQEALEIGSPDTLNQLLKRHASLVEVQSAGQGKADTLRLTAEGQAVARELGFEVLGEGGAR